MNMKLLAATGAAALGLVATSASATSYTQNGETVNVTSTQIATFSDYVLPTGLTLINDFDTIVSGSYLFSGGTTMTGTTGSSAAPPGDGTPYESVQPGNPFTITDLVGGIKSISFYMGSPDEYNDLSLTVNGNLGPITLSGSQIWGGSPQGNGDQTLGYIVTYTFSPNQVHSLSFSTTSPAFELDNVAASTSVPEPASWALMIMGFGAAGAMLRRRKAVVA